MQKIEYGDILKKAWGIVWSNKFLWLLGFFVAIGSGLSGYSYNNSSDSNAFEDSVSLFIQKYPVVFVSIIVLLVVLAIFLYVIGTFSRAALVRSINDVTIYSQVPLLKLISGGRQYFWRLFFLDVVFGLATFSVIFIVVLPAALLFYFKAYVLGFLSALGAVVIFVPILIAAHFIKKYAGFYVILSDMGFRKSIEYAYVLFSKSLKESLIMALISLGLGILINVCFVVTIIFVAGMMFLMGFSLWFVIKDAGIVAATVTGLILFVVLIAVFAGIYQAYFHAIWVIFFKNMPALHKEKIEKKVEEEVSMEKTIAAPEAI